MLRKEFHLAVLVASVLLANAQPLHAQLRGILIDDAAAELEGVWKRSTHVKPFFGEGYRHDENADKGKKAARFATQVPEDGQYRILLAYTTGGSRATNVPVTIETADGPQKVTVNQREAPPLSGFCDLGQFAFNAANDVVVVVSNEGTDGHVIVDAVQIVTPEEFKLVQQDAKKKPDKVADQDKKETPPASDAVPNFERQPVDQFAAMTPEQLDVLLAEELGGAGQVPLVGDEIFLRRATLDIVGRQPTVAELEAFLADQSSTKRSDVVQRLLASPDYGRNWGNYWSDVIEARQQEPQLTFHDYRPFKKWLAEQFNSERKWDEIVFDMLTALGKVGDKPAGTFIAFHQADANKLAGETSRVFLGVKVHCAECHEHPFVPMPMETFHGMAAFFARTQADIPWNESSEIELKSKSKGEHKIPGYKSEMQPVALFGFDSSEQYKIGTPDLQRRAKLAEWTVHPENPFFARSYVNRIWARMMGRGFYEPVDDLGETAEDVIMPELHDALADHFIATNYDHKAVVRLIANTRAYQRTIEPPPTSQAEPLAAAKTKQLRGDEVFDSLATAVGLPNIQPEKPKPTAAIRFPVPPKSTRDLVNKAFGYDPSFKDELLVRSMDQAMFMMNNQQLQEQINADPDSGTYLSKLLREQPDDKLAAVRLYRAVLARTPTDNEMDAVLAHVERVNDRGAALEDILWSLINSAEFTTRR